MLATRGLERLFHELAKRLDSASQVEHSNTQNDDKNRLHRETDTKRNHDLFRFVGEGCTGL